MKKRNIFSRQAVNFLWVLLGLGAGLQFIEVIWAASKGYLGFFSMMVVIVTEMVITGSIYVIIYKFLIKPCNETRKLFKHFIQSGSFQELIDQDYQIFPEQNEVMQKLDSILDKKNIIELSTKHAELLALQNQINPHFLYNTLDSIIWMAEGKKNEEVVLMTASLARLLRQSISNEDELVSIGQEIEYARGYLTIQKMRYKDKLEFWIEVEPSILNIRLIKLVLQPVIENAIYHGLKYKESRGLLLVKGFMKNGNAVLQVIDDGVGMDQETLDHIYERHKVDYHSNGVGIYNVQKRLQLYYGNEYGIVYESKPGEGTTATITIPGQQEGL